MVVVVLLLLLLLLRRGLLLVLLMRRWGRHPWRHSRPGLRRRTALTHVPVLPRLSLARWTTWRWRSTRMLGLLALHCHRNLGRQRLVTSQDPNEKKCTV